jgi:hypothetical protein
MCAMIPMLRVFSNEKGLGISLYLLSALEAVLLRKHRAFSTRSG